MKIFNFSIIIILLFLSLIGCKPQKQIFQGVDIKDSTRLFFYYNPENFYKEASSNSYLSEEGMFYISDPLVLNKIINNWRFEKATDSKPLLIFYRLSLVNGNEIIRDVTLDIENHRLITHEGNFSFEMDSLNNYKEGFIKTEGNLIKCSNFIDARILFNELVENKAFIPIRSDGGLNPLFTMEGEITLISNSIFDKSEISNIKKQIIAEFNGNNNASLMSLVYEKDKERFVIKLACKKSFIDEIPTEYSIHKPYSELTNIELFVYGLSLTKIEELILKNNLNDIEVKPLVQ